MVMIQFDWDPEKAIANLTKHGVSFELAMRFFSDPLALTIADRLHSGDEERWITIGLASPSQLVLVVHTHVEVDEETVYVRIISARKPTRTEQRQYEDGEIEE